MLRTRGYAGTTQQTAVRGRAIDGTAMASRQDRQMTELCTPFEGPYVTCTQYTG